MVIAVSGAKGLTQIFLVTSVQDATYAVEEELVEEGRLVYASLKREVCCKSLRG